MASAGPGRESLVDREFIPLFFLSHLTQLPKILLLLLLLVIDDVFFFSPEIISVITNDGRNIVVSPLFDLLVHLFCFFWLSLILTRIALPPLRQGTLRGFDQATNIILDESHERVYSTRVGLLPTLSTLLSCYLANLQLILQQYQYFTKLVLYALIIRQHTLYFHLHKVMFTRRSYLQLVTLLNFSAFRISTTVCLAFSIELPVC